MSRQVSISSLFIVCGLAATPAHAGIYGTMDADAEVKQYSRDYRNVFKPLLDTLKTIPNDDTISHPPIRKRYLLLEHLGRTGASGLKSLEEKLNYSAVLIRRGKGYEATQFLLPLTREHPENFIVWSQYATAHFLSNNPDFRKKSADLMKQAMELWPEHEDEVKADLKPFLQNLGLVGTEYERFRAVDRYLERLIRNRLREDRARQQMKPVEETIDPIFVDGDSKPVRYLSNKGEFEPGKIADDEKKKLPNDAIEFVEQLLLWMPYDQRLHWQLGELFNASAADAQKDDQRNRAVRDAFFIFNEIDPPLNRTRFAPKEIQERKEKLGEYVKGLPPEQALGLDKIGNLLNDDPPGGTLTSREWWRALAVGGVTGFAVGLFALWQLQEWRRRRQAR